MDINFEHTLNYPQLLFMERPFEDLMIPPLQILGYSIVPAADAIKLQSSSCFTFHMDGPWFPSSQRGGILWTTILRWSCFCCHVFWIPVLLAKWLRICIPKLSMASESIGSYDYRIGCKGGSQSSPRDFMESLSTFGFHESNVGINRTASLHLYRRLGFPSPLLSLIDWYPAFRQYQMTTAAGLSSFYTLGSLPRSLWHVYPSVPFIPKLPEGKINRKARGVKTIVRTASPALLGATGPTTPIRPWGPLKAREDHNFGWSFWAVDNLSVVANSHSCYNNYL